MSSKDSAPPITVPNLITELQTLARDEACVLAFDGDGTLWGGDVSDDVFLAACRAEWLLDDVGAALDALLERFQLPRQTSPSRAALCLFEAEKVGAFPERELFEMMTWCYAGRTRAQLTAFAESVLLAAHIEARLRRSFLAVFDWASSRGHDVYLVTASPWPIVTVAAQRLGFHEQNVIAARAIEDVRGHIIPKVASNVPYAGEKPLQLQPYRRERRLLAAFGDSLFDFELLSSADLAVAVNPKPLLEQRLHRFERAVRLEL
jgi:HAD superfamily phosphoserine phosphatase-like hydrolase